MDEHSLIDRVAAAFSRAVFTASDLVYGPWTIALLFGIGIFLTLRFRMVQFGHWREALAAMRRAPARGGGALTPFQAFTTALAASIGTGNIAGVATAIVSGGPGALFWIWCYGIVATAIKFAEAVLGVRYRQLGEGRLSAGPMHYLRDGLGMPRLGWLYALIAGIAALTTTPFTQPNSIAVVLESELGVPPLATGIGVALLTWLVIVGGVKSIGRVAEKLAPAKVILYFAGGMLVLLLHAERLPATLALVVTEAFSFRAAAGSAAGIGIMVAMRYGLARGMYANEAGYGTAAVAYGTAQSERPVLQGYAAVLEVFIISFVTSTMSALTILVTGVWRSGLTSTPAVAAAFNQAIPVVGGWVVAFCSFMFGYTTLIGWAYYGEQFLEYIFGPRVVTPYRWLYSGLVVFGATGRVDLIWAWGDLMNGLQIFPNLVGVVGLSGVVARLLKDEEERARVGAGGGRIVTGFVRAGAELLCDGVSLEAAAAEHGTPLYVYSRAAIEAAYAAYARAFAPVPHRICYAVKANGNGAILKLLASLGAGADIVSGGELLAALRAGFPPSRIVFAGVGKTDAELALGLEHGIGEWNAESEDEIERLAAAATARGTRARLSLRVNPDIDARSHPYISTGLRENKFGVDIAAALPILRRARERAGIEIAGVQSHIGSQIVDTGPLAGAARALAELSRTLLAEGFKLETLDIGGGLGVSYDGAGVPDASRLAAAVLPALEGLPLTLVLEPGRSLVASAGALLTRVLYVKQGHGKRFVVVDAGMNDLLRPSLYQAFHRIEPVRTRDRPSELVDVVGPVCETSDFLARARELERVEPGELLLVRDAGAYGFAMASNYNMRPRAAEVLVEAGRARLIRRRETFEDLVRGEA